MAENEIQKQEPASAEVDTAPSTQKHLNPIILGGIILLQAILVLLLQRFVFFKDISVSSETFEAIAKMDSASYFASIQAQEEEVEEYTEEQTETHNIGEIYQLKNDIVINPKDTYAIRFLATEVAFELEPIITAAEVGSWEPVIRDKIITLFMSKEMNFYTNTENKNVLKDEIKEQIELLIGKDTIRNVYFPKFVLQ